MILQYTLGILFLFALILFFQLKGTANVTPSKSEYNPYTELRNIALNSTPEIFGLELENENDIYGIVMDWDMGDAVVTVVAFKTGDASIYISVGKAMIGGYAHEKITNAAKQFVTLGNKYLPKAVLTVNTEVKAKKVSFYLLTKSGKYYLVDDVSNIEKNESEFQKLFNAGNHVITEYRLMIDMK